jgi:hypothetical protein
MLNKGGNSLAHGTRNLGLLITAPFVYSSKGGGRSNNERRHNLKYP